MTKACREAKLHTSWTEPDEAYEGAVHQLIDLVLADKDLAERIGNDIRPYAWYGALNSLSITALKLTVPGVPDIYQGANVLDDSLVDPDNRRPVDFAAREGVIRELVDVAARPAVEIRKAVAQWLADGDLPRLKLWTLHRLLGWRAPASAALRIRRLSADAAAGGPRGIASPTSQQPTPRHPRARDTPLSRTRLPGPDAAAAAERGLWEDTCADLRRRAFVIRSHGHPPRSGAGRERRPGSEGTRRPALRLEYLLETLPIAIISFDIEPEAS